MGENMDLNALVHPFTMLVCGPTSSGKSTFVKQLIDNADTMINPSPQKITWYFGQWQPLYVDIKTMHPSIDFEMGLPSNFDDLDPDVNNLVIIDDMMSDATREKAVAELFTRGSHHRNTSVICILQNMFYHGRENRTLSLNSHYLVLFKNPRDQQQISILARQMYPSNPNTLLKAYQKATEQPYGYLLIDLKQETPEANRLKNVSVHLNKNILPMDNTRDNSDTASTKRVSMVPYGQNTQQTSTYTNNEPATTLQQQTVLGKIPHCFDCGALFVSHMDVTNHRKRAMCMHDDDDDSRTDMPATKTRALDYDVRENQTLVTMRRNIGDSFDDEFKRLMSKYKDRGLSEEDALEKSWLKMLPEVKARFLQQYGRLLYQIVDLNRLDIHNTIVKCAQALMEDGDSPNDAIRKTLFKFPRLVEELFDKDTTYFSNEEDSDEEDDADEG